MDIRSLRIRHPRIRFLGIESFLPRSKNKPLCPVTKGRYAVYNTRVSYRIENGKLKVIGG